MKNIIGNLKGFNLGDKPVGMNIPALIITWVIPLWGKVLDSAYNFSLIWNARIFSGTNGQLSSEKEDNCLFTMMEGEIRLAGKGCSARRMGQVHHSLADNSGQSVNLHTY